MTESKLGINAREPDGWIIWRCPDCNCWDWANQGKESDFPVDKTWICDECGNEFIVGPSAFSNVEK